MRALLSTLFWIFLMSTSVVLFVGAMGVWAVTVLFDRRLAVLHRYTSIWASLYTWLNPAWRVTVEGREKIDPKTAYVMVANHLSLLDILVLFRLATHFKWVSKAENFKLPFIGWNMSLNGYVKLRRGEKASVMQMMRACRAHLSAGSSLMIFPEGTRSPSGRIRRFKSGAFEIAQAAGCPILPIVLQGTADALPKRGVVLQGRHHIKVRCLDAIPFESFRDEDAESLTTRIHDLIAAELEKDAAAN
jgi:1-acyl-sn-glycerol-3-phosphate acyltransferase